MESMTVHVDVQPKSYKIHIAYDAIDRIAAEIAGSCTDVSRYAVITDSHVRPLYGDQLVRSLRGLGLNVLLLDFMAGEASKTKATKDRIDEQLLNENFGRDGAIIALGGGVVGDLAGFVAATYMRGILCIQVPTTVVAQGDSSIGGKTAVNVPQGKNLIGAFHHPRSVFIDIKTLESLDDRHYRNGLVEIVKHGLVRSEPFFEFIERNIDLILARRSQDDAYASVMTELMYRNCDIKNDIVSADEKERDLRKILNYGHTIAHAVEFLSNYALLHGEAVAIGMACEAYFSCRLGYCSEAAMARQIDILRKLQMPCQIPPGIGIEEIVEKMRLDKKARSAEPEFVLIEKVGQTKVFDQGGSTTKIDRTALLSMLAEFQKGLPL